eukprot:Colp12_sorted_trinity150504_noHs@1478
MVGLYALKVQQKVIYVVAVVANVTYEKHVTLRVTSDKWASFQDVPATFVSSLNGAHDLFAAEIPIKKEALQNGVEFAIVYWPQHRGEHWANNGGQNFKLNPATLSEVSLHPLSRGVSAPVFSTVPMTRIDPPTPNSESIPQSPLTGSRSLPTTLKDAMSPSTARKHNLLPLQLPSSVNNHSHLHASGLHTEPSSPIAQHTAVHVFHTVPEHLPQRVELADSVEQMALHTPLHVSPRTPERTQPVRSILKNSPSTTVSPVKEGVLSPAPAWY